jgi:hypothetical protein
MSAGSPQRIQDTPAASIRERMGISKPDVFLAF